MTRPDNVAAGRANALRGLLDAVASREPGPAGGWSAAATVGFGAALTAMAARASSRQLPDSAFLAHRADRLHARAAELAEADVAAYRKVLDASGPRPMADSAPWRARLSAALAEATDVPLAVAEAGAEVTALAARLAREGHPQLRADARTGAVLAEAATRAAAEIVAVNAAAGGLGQERTSRARAHAESAAASLQADQAEG